MYHLMLMAFTALSAAKVRLQLAQEDAAATITEGSPSQDTMTPSVLLAQGLDLEEHQARLRVDVKSLPANPSETKTTQMTERRTRLMRRITAWQTAQELLIPGVGLHRRCVETTTTSPEDMDLMLPSGLPSSTPIDTTFYDYEWRLRTGQAHDNLSELRRQLLIISTMYQSKDRLIRGQQHNTRSATLINNIQARIKFLSDRYRANREALLTLSEILGKTGWATTLLPLEDSDIRSLRAGDDASSSEGRRTLSWIWMTQRTNADEMTDTMGEGMFVLSSKNMFCMNFKFNVCQRFESSGVNRGHEHIGGRRNAYYLKRKCAE